jgi:predicted dithiol-disulfide oxidoreductase (DUF899 family)
VFVASKERRSLPQRERRRHIERVAEQRRSLPGGVVPTDHRFVGENVAV